MRSRFSVIILSLLLAGTLPAHARADSATSDIEVALQIQTILAESVVTAPQSEIDTLNDVTGPDYMKSLATRALDAGLKSAVEAQARRTGIARMASQLKWGTLWAKAKAIGPKLRTTARLKGRSIAILAVSGVALKTAHFVTCLVLGRPELIPLTSSFVPGPLPLMALGVGVGKFMDRKRQVAIYGGPENLAAVNASLKEAREELGLLSSEHFLIPFSSDAVQSISLVVRQSGLMARIKGFFGKSPAAADLNEFSEFALAQGVSAEFLTGLQRYGLPVEVKTLWILRELEQIHGDRTVVLIAQHFPASVVARELPALREAWVEAILALRKAKSLSELTSLLSTAGTAPGEELATIRVWNQIVMPALAENLERGVSVTQFRKLLKSSIELQARVETGRAGDPSVIDQLRTLVREVQVSEDCEQPLIPVAA